MRFLIHLALVASLAATAVAQANLRPGTDVLLSNLGGIQSPTSARVGTFPNGVQSWGISTTSCNVGTVNVPWLRDMNPDHPSIGMFMYREYNGRFEQVSMFHGVKHGFTSTNSGGCGTCPGGAGTSLVVGCSDTYGASLNYSHTWLGPPSEIDPWLGVWTSRGSHFDRGFPVQSPPFDTDDVRSSINFPTGNQGYRNLAVDSELNVSGATFWVSGVYAVTGEPDAKRENNFATRQFNPTWSGSQWNWAMVGSTQYREPAIYRWAGASVQSASNGNDDGRFYVAVKVTGPTNGAFHYEYAVFNRDNNRQGAAIRIPICGAASVANLYFHDPDPSTAGDWTFSRGATELVWTAPAGHANDMSWGNLFNFGFDSDAAPANGLVGVDQAFPGAGAASVDVASSCPLDVRNVILGAGCGTPMAPELTANGPARIGNTSFALSCSAVAPSSSTLFVLSLTDANLGVGVGCTLWIDPAFVFLSDGVTANGAGVATLSVPVPNDPALDTAVFAVQAAELQASGAWGSLDLSNGLKIKLGTGNSGCN